MTVMRHQLKGRRLCSTRWNRWHSPHRKEEIAEEGCIESVSQRPFSFITYILGRGVTRLVQQCFLTPEFCSIKNEIYPYDSFQILMSVPVRLRISALAEACHSQ